MSNTKRLVIIDGDSGTRRLLRNATETTGWWVDDGSRHIDVWAAVRHADVVALDMHLQDEDGLDVLQQLRREGVTAPIVAVSDDDSPVLEAEAFAAGATHYVMKPFEISRLVDLLEEHKGAAKREVLIELTSVAEPVLEKAWFMS